MTATLDRAGMQARHWRREYPYDPSPLATSRCDFDKQRWPCDAIQALDALAEVEREHASILAATRAAGIGWRENEDGAETCHNARAEALEADLAEARVALERAARVYHVADQHGTAPGWDGSWEACISPTCESFRAALASSPGAAFPVNNVVACVNCKRPVEVTALNAIRCDACGAAWLATAREVVGALEDFVNLHLGNPMGSPDPITHARALLARPEVKAWAGR